MAGVTGPKTKRLLPPANLPVLAKQGYAIAQKVGAKSALIGGVAVQAYGLSRATKDVDFAVTRGGAASIERLLRDDHRAFSGLKIGGLSVEESDGHIDFIDRRFGPHALFEEAIAAAETAGTIIEAEGVTIPVVPLEYLIALKMVGARPQDDADLDFLLKRTELDFRAARNIVKQHLGDIVARYLDRAARIAGRVDVAADYD
jgi:hypothetical protein